MTLKEKFLAVKSYEEFDKKRAEFRGLDASDKDIQKHFLEIFPKPSPPFGPDGEIVYYHTKVKKDGD